MPEIPPPIEPPRVPIKPLVVKPVISSVPTLKNDQLNLQGHVSIAESSTHSKDRDAIEIILTSEGGKESDDIMHVMGETPPELPEIDVISHTETVKPKGIVAGVKRAASKAAKTIGLEEAAEKLNPDVTMDIIHPVDLDAITIIPESQTAPGEQKSVKTEKRKLKKRNEPKIKIVDPEPSIHPDEIILVGESNREEPIIPNSSEEALSVDILERREAQRINSEAPTITTVIGEDDSRPGFERIIMDGKTLHEMTNFMRQDMSNETGGFLVGQFCKDPKTGEKFTKVSEFLANETGTQTWGSFQFAPKDMANIWRRLDQINAGQNEEFKVVGWVHCHPAGVDVAPQSNSVGEPTGDSIFGDRRIMKDHFDSEGQITLIYGKGSTYDNQYAVWRPLNGKALLQKGFEVENASGETYGYYKGISELPLEE